MANELQTNLNEILQDKNTNLLPENLKAGVICLGINGTMQSGIDTSDATATSNDIIQGKTAYINGEKVTGTLSSDRVKLFKTVEEMNASTNNKNGDIAIVDNVEKFTISSTSSNYSYIYLPSTITVTEEDAAILDADTNVYDTSAFLTIGDCMIGGAGVNFMFGYTQSEKQYFFSLDAGQIYFRYTRQTPDTAFTTMAGEYILNIPENGIVNNDMMDVKLAKDTYNNLSFIKNLVFLKNVSTFSGVYIYSKNWSHLKNSMYSYADGLEKGRKAYATDGIITGTLDLSAKYQPVYMNAYSSQTLCNAIDNSTPINLSATPDRTYLYNKSKMPEIGDKRYFICYGRYDDPMMPEATVYSIGYYTTTNPDAKIIIERDSYTSEAKINNVTSDTNNWTKYKNNALSDIWHNSGKDTFSLSNMKSSVNTIQAEIEQENVKVNVDNVAITSERWDFCIATNCEVVDTNGKLVLPAGPKASTTLKGQYYTNITGENIEGTAEVKQPLTLDELSFEGLGDDFVSLHNDKFEFTDYDTNVIQNIEYAGDMNGIFPVFKDSEIVKIGVVGAAGNNSYPYVITKLKENQSDHYEGYFTVTINYIDGTKKKTLSNHTSLMGRTYGEYMVYSTSEFSIDLLTNIDKENISSIEISMQNTM